MSKTELLIWCSKPAPPPLCPNQLMMSPSWVSFLSPFFQHPVCQQVLPLYFGNISRILPFLIPATTLLIETNILSFLDFVAFCNCSLSSFPPKAILTRTLRAMLLSCQSDHTSPLITTGKVETLRMTLKTFRDSLICNSPTVILSSPTILCFFLCSSPNSPARPWRCQKLLPQVFVLVFSSAWNPLSHLPTWLSSPFFQVFTQKLWCQKVLP